MFYPIKGLFRFVLFLIFRPFVKYDSYHNPAQVDGWAGWYELPIVGVVAFLKDNGKRSFVWNLLLALLLGGLLLMPVEMMVAQDATPADEAETQEVTAVPVPDAPVVVEPVEEPAQLDPEIVTSMFDAVRDIAITAITWVAGGGAFVGLVLGILGIRALRNLGEKLFLSGSPDQQKQITETWQMLRTLLMRGVDFVDDVTDGVLGGKPVETQQYRSVPSADAIEELRRRYGYDPGETPSGDSFGG